MTKLYGVLAVVVAVGCGGSSTTADAPQQTIDARVADAHVNGDGQPITDDGSIIIIPDAPIHAVDANTTPDAQIIDANHTIDATPAPFCSPTSGSAFTLTPVATGLEEPLLLTAPAGDPRAFIVQQTGKILVLKDGALLPTPFLDVSAIIATDDPEQGLLGLAFHPDFASNGRFFISYSLMGAGNRVISEWHSDPTSDVADSTPEKILVSVVHPYGNHNGGSIEFGPRDGLLYFGLGDGGGDNDLTMSGQNPATMAAKILRVDVDHNVGNETYTVPSSNPWAPGMANIPSGGVPEMFAWGFRNPWRFAFDPAGDLFVGDVGQSAEEEIDVIPVGTDGQNFGWPVFEGPNCYQADASNPECPNPEQYTQPLVSYAHNSVAPLPAGRCAVMGGYVYEGACMPDVDGTYFYGDRCTGEIDTFQFVNGAAINQTIHTTDIDPTGELVGLLDSFGRDGYGELYAITVSEDFYNGSVYRIGLAQ